MTSDYNFFSVGQLIDWSSSFGLFIKFAAGAAIFGAAFAALAPIIRELIIETERIYQETPLTLNVQLLNSVEEGRGGALAPVEKYATTSLSSPGAVNRHLNCNCHPSSQNGYGKLFLTPKGKKRR